MNNLAESIVENSAFGLKNKVHHRQFLPATDRVGETIQRRKIRYS